MKKGILKITGVAALAVLMAFNISSFTVEGGSDISLAYLGKMVYATTEGGDDPNVEEDFKLTKRIVTCDEEPYFFDEWSCQPSPGDRCYCSSEYFPC